MQKENIINNDEKSEKSSLVRWTSAINGQYSVFTTIFVFLVTALAVVVNLFTQIDELNLISLVTRLTITTTCYLLYQALSKLLRISSLERDSAYARVPDIVKKPLSDQEELNFSEETKKNADIVRLLKYAAFLIFLAVNLILWAKPITYYLLACR